MVSPQFLIDADAAGITQRISQLSKICSQVNFHYPLQPLGSVAVDANKTLCLQIPAISDFESIKIRLRNFDTSGVPLVATKVFVAAANSDLADGSALDWRQLTFSGQASVTIPAPVVDGSFLSIVPNFVDSDAINLAPADGKAYLQVRIYTASGFTTETLKADGDLGVIATNYPDIKFGCAIAAGDKTDGSAVTLSRAGSSIIGGCMVAYSGKTPSISVIGFGDSIMAIGGSWTQLSWFNLGCRGATTSSIDFAHLNFAVIGQTHGAAMQSGRAILFQGYAPNVLVINVCSPNNGGLDSAGYLACLRDAQETARRCRASGGVCVITTMQAYSSCTDHAARRAMNAQLISEACMSYRVLDMASILDDPENQNQLLPEYDSGDHTHLSQAGQIAVADEFSILLASIGASRI